MTEQPFFSVVVPVYNRSDIISATLSSILKQSFKNFEVVVVDDESTDASLRIIKELQERNSVIRLIQQQNKERGAARNAGFANSGGSYVIFFDSDDLMHENHLEVLHRNIQEHKRPYFIATKFDFVDEAGRHYDSDISKLREGFYDYKLFLNGNPLACNVCVSRENKTLFLFEEDRRYSIKEDWLFLIQNTMNQKLFLVDDVTITMLDHSGRSMRSDNVKIIQRTLLARDWILEKVSLDDKEKKQLDAHVNYFCGIHAYLDKNKKDGFQFIRNAVKTGGIKLKYITLFIKMMVGKNLISRLK